MRRLLEISRVLGELEQLATRSNNDLLVEIERLREENERLRKDSAVSAAIERAAKDLPDGDMLEITVEKGSAMVVLY